MGQLIIIIIIIITSQIKLNFAGCLWFVALTGYYYSTLYALSVTVACIVESVVSVLHHLYGLINRA